MMKFKIQQNLHNHILADECSNNHIWDLKIDSLSSSNLLIKIKIAVNQKLKQMKDEWIKLYIWKQCNELELSFILMLIYWYKAHERKIIEEKNALKYALSGSTWISFN